MAAVPLIIPHWYRLIEDLQASPKDFYASVQQAIKRRQVPDARRSRVDWREACSSRFGSSWLEGTVAVESRSPQPYSDGRETVARYRP